MCQSASARAAAERGRSLLEQREYAAAVSALEQSLSSCPAETGVRLDLARALALDRRYAQARRESRFVVSEHPHMEGAWLGLGFVEFMAQEFEEARKAADRALKLNRHNVPALKLKANALYLLGDESGAETAFITAMERAPDDTELHYMLGRIYYQQNRFEHAEAQFQTVLRLDQESYRAHDNLGLCYEALNQDKLAIHHFMTAIQMVYKDHPEYAWPYSNLASLMLRLGENDKAFSLAMEAAKRDPYTAKHCFLTGKALRQLEQWEPSVRWFERAIELDSEYADARYALAQVYKQLGRDEDARSQLMKFQELSKTRARKQR